MDRRGFVTAGVVAGLAGLSGPALSLEALRSGPAHAWKGLSANADGVIRLNSNENPLGLSGGARAAVGGTLDIANRYPRELRDQLTSALAERFGVGRDQVVLGAGSTEVLQMAVQAYEAPGVRLVIADPTFEDVPRYQRPFAYDLIKVPLRADHAHDLGRMREVAEEHRRPAVVYVCNPNNPTGTLTPSADVDAWIRSAHETTLFVVDEAYFEYARHPDYWTALDLVHDHPNVVVVRTFSKIYGMAGMRVGYGLAHPDTAQRLREFMAANNVNQLALAAALASLDDEHWAARSLEVNDAARAIADETLDALGLEFLPSHTNFLMHRIPGDLNTYRQRMRERGILVGRAFPPMLSWNRVSLGLPDEMARWAEALRAFRTQGWV